jgi:hypothetical protein
MVIGVSMSMYLRTVCTSSLLSDLHPLPSRRYGLSCSTKDLDFNAGCLAKCILKVATEAWARHSTFPVLDVCVVDNNPRPVSRKSAV